MNNTESHDYEEELYDQEDEDFEEDDDEYDPDYESDDIEDYDEDGRYVGSASFLFQDDDLPSICRGCTFAGQCRTCLED